MIRELISYRSHAAALLVLLAVSLLATQVPLFNYLGYEFSALIALAWSLSAGLLTISLWNKDARRDDRGQSSFLVRSITLCLVPLAIPVIVISANAVFVKNCSFTQGAVLFGLIAVPAALFTHALGFVVAVTVERWKKTAFVLLWLLLLSHIAFVTFVRPQIFAFNPILGFFAGLTYDETLDVLDRLILYRIGTVAFTGLLLLAALYITEQRKNRRENIPTTFPVIKRVVAVVLFTIVCAIYGLSDRLGLSSSVSYIEESLGGKAVTDHFIISYPDTLLKSLRLEQVVQLHEFYYDQLVKVLRVRPDRKIHTFLYASQEQKGRLIGASGTDFAKPWLRQLHINLSDVDGALRHELVHVLAADFGFPILQVGVNSGLIEGLAVAVDRVQYEEPIHRLAAMVFATGMAPDVSTLFSLSGFIKAPAGVSYTLAGSFCRYLIDRYGMRRFRLLYGTGEFEIIYGSPLSALLQEWRKAINGYQFNDAELAKAGYLFKRRSIFGKECARVIANLNKETRDLLGKHMYPEALESAERSLKHTMSADAVYQKTTALLRLGKFDDAMTFTKRILGDTVATPSFLTLKLSLGDALWGVDSLEGGMKVYSELLRSHLSSGWDESLSLRLEILLKPDLARALKPYLLASNEDSVRIQLLENIVRQYPRESIPRYFLAREMIAKDSLENAIRLLEEISAWRAPILEFSRQRRLGQLFSALGKYEKAKVHYWQSLNYLFRDAQATEIDEKLRFCDWMESFHRGVN
jgi:tetratricopeptide (TPR) repeat protein